MLSLAEIEGLKTFQARILYKSGLRTPEEVYQCSTQRIAQILSDNDVRARANPGRYLGMYAKIAKRVHSAARDLLSRRAEELLREKKAECAMLASRVAEQEAVMRDQLSRLLEYPAITEKAMVRAGKAVKEAQREKKMARIERRD